MNPRAAAGDRADENRAVCAADTRERTMIGNTTVPQRTYARALLTGVAAATLAGCLFNAAARAEDARVKHMSFEIQSPYQAAIVKVTSSTGARWDTILPGEIGFNAVMQVDTAWPGYVERAGIFLGKCSNTECGNNPRVYFAWPASRDFNRSELVTFSVDKLKAAAPSIFGQRYEETILQKCNDGYADATTPHTEHLGVDASFTVNTRKTAGKIPPGEVTDGEDAFNGGDHTRHSAFLVQIDCLATSKTVENPKEPHRTKIGTTDIDLFLSTYATPAGTQSGPRGTQCKPLKVTTRIATDKAGPVNVKLWRQVNGGPITGEGKQMHAAALGGGKFGDDWNKFEHFTQTTTVQYKAEVLGGTFAPSTPWKSITIHCNGDYAAPQTNANPDSHPRKPLPPAIVTPPPATCGNATSSAAKVRGPARCHKTAQLPDKRKEAAEQKRKAAQETELRRREAALRAASELRRQDVMHRPHRFGRFAGPGRPMSGPVFGMGVIYRAR
jgi:hypothetical protein